MLEFTTANKHVVSVTPLRFEDWKIVVECPCLRVIASRKFSRVTMSRGSRNYTVIKLLTLPGLNYTDDENFSPFYCPDINLGGIKKRSDKAFRSRVDSRSSGSIDKFRGAFDGSPFRCGASVIDEYLWTQFAKWCVDTRVIIMSNVSFLLSLFFPIALLFFPAFSLSLFSPLLFPLSPLSLLFFFHRSFPSSVFNRRGDIYCGVICWVKLKSFIMRDSGNGGPKPRSGFIFIIIYAKLNTVPHDPTRVRRIEQHLPRWNSFRKFRRHSIIN